MQASIEANLKCYHCGEDCAGVDLTLEEKYFCCTGCKTVYEILNSNNLCGYYDISSSPGKKAKSYPLEKYAYLDNENIANRLLEFTGEGISKITFYLPAIHCNSCVWLLENLGRLNPGVLNSKINFLKKELTITFDELHISLAGLAELLDSINYPPCINLQQLDKIAERPVTKSIYYKIAIAGFCFGNIMLLSFPDYLSSGLAAYFAHFFSYLSLILSLPVFFYCASEYFISSYNGLKAKVINIDFPIALGLFTVYARSVYEIISHSGTGYLDSFSGLVFFLLIGKWYQKKTYDALSFDRDYKSYFPVSVIKINNRKYENTAINELKEGDRILVRNQELIPSDSVLIKGVGNIDYSFVTGESNPIPKKEGEQIYAGGRQLGESIELLLSKKVSQSYFTQLWNQDEYKKKQVSGIGGFTNIVGKYFTIAVLIASAFTYTYWTFQDPTKAFFSSISVLIIFCPCILALAIPFCFGNAMHILGKHGFYLKNIDNVEALAKVNTIVFDKTGTLTYCKSEGVEFVGDKLSTEILKLIKSITKNSTHPLSVTIFNSIAEELYQVHEYKEISFEGISGIIKGQEVKLGSYSFVTGKSDRISDSFSSVYISIDGYFPGYYRIGNKLRTGIKGLISSLKKKYELYLLSGDSAFQKKYFTQLFNLPDSVQFKQSPSDKLNYISNLKNQGKYVLMVGDGLNDAGALKHSDVGISVADDVYNFSPACDAIIDSSKLKNLHKYLRFCRNCSDIVKLSLAISLSYNFIGLYFAVEGKLSPMVAAILMPASSLTVVLFVIISSNIFSRRLNFSTNDSSDL